MFREKTLFVKGEFFHLFNKSIAGYGIFKDLKNSHRFVQSLDYYNSKTTILNLSKYLVKSPG